MSTIFFMVILTLMSVSVHNLLNRRLLGIQADAAATNITQMAKAHHRSKVTDLQNKSWSMKYSRLTSHWDKEAGKLLADDGLLPNWNTSAPGSDRYSSRPFRERDGSGWKQGPGISIRYQADNPHVAARLLQRFGPVAERNYLDKTMTSVIVTFAKPSDPEIIAELVSRDGFRAMWGTLNIGPDTDFDGIIDEAKFTMDDDGSITTKGPITAAAGVTVGPESDPLNITAAGDINGVKSIDAESGTFKEILISP